MKTIENIKTDLKKKQIKQVEKEQQNDKLDYKDLIEYCLDVVPQGGFKPEDIRKRNRIQLALDKMKENKIKFEDSDFNNLKKIVNESRWIIRDKDLAKFLEKFKNEDE